MLVRTILNDCYKFKSFIYGKAHFERNNKRIFIEVHPRKSSQPICSGCGQKGPTYDTQKERQFEFVPLWGYLVFLLYRMRRVHCPSCGIKIEKVPWAEGKSTLTKAYKIFLAKWAKSLTWEETAKRFNTSWKKVYQSVKYVVDWGIKHRNLEDIKAIGVDEVKWKVGHKFLTLVYQVDKGEERLLFIAKDRTKESFSDMLGEKRCKKVKYVCSDMWKNYLEVASKRIGQAIHILDRYHIVARLNKALDSVRAEEHRKMKQDGYEPVLTKSRWTLLKKPENLNADQNIKLKELLKCNLKTMRAYLLKESFQRLWEYVSEYWAGLFIDKWTKKAMLSKIEPMKKEAQTIRRHKSLILNYFRAKKVYSSGVVEGLNNKVKVTTRRSYGFREYETIKIALYHQLGKFPEPPSTHRFC